MGNSATARRFDVDGVTFDLALRADDRWLYVDRHPPGEWHEQPLTAFFISAARQATCFLDVGAHIGWYSCLVGIASERCEIVAFEPSADTARVLRANLDLNRVLRSTVVVAGVGEGGGRGRLLRSGLTTMEACVEAGCGIGDPVEIVSIDEWCSAFGCSPDLVKIDVEGGEVNALLGMVDTVRRCQPQLFVEVHRPELGAACRGILEVARYSVETVRLAAPQGHWMNEVLWATAPNASARSSLARVPPRQDAPKKLLPRGLRQSSD